MGCVTRPADVLPSRFDRRQGLPAIELEEGVSCLVGGGDIGHVRASRLTQRRHRSLAPIAPAAEHHPQMMGVHVLACLHYPPAADLVNETVPIVVDAAIVEMREYVHFFEHPAVLGYHMAESDFDGRGEMLYQRRIQ